jgi:hypothetical protein
MEPMAKLAGILKVGNLSLDGSKIHADASKSKAVSYERLVELEKQLQNEAKQLFELGEQALLRCACHLSSKRAGCLIYNQKV